MDADWAADARAALIRGDEPELRRLFVELVARVGREQASRDWLAISSTLDASAQTG